MNKETIPVEKYEQEIIEPLHKMEMEGKGKVIELCQLRVHRFYRRFLPFVAFTTGEDILLTGGFCPYAAFGTYETALEVCNQGIEGITVIPTVTPWRYDETVKYIERGKNHLVDLIRDLFGKGTYGESDEPSTFRMYPIFEEMGWNKPSQLEPTRKIIEMLARTKVVLDLRNGYTFDGSYILVSKSIENRIQNGLDCAIVNEILPRKHEISDYVSNLYRTDRKKILYGPRDELCNTASELGVLNYVINVPTVIYDKGGIRMTDMRENVETNTAAITRCVKLLR